MRAVTKPTKRLSPTVTIPAIGVIPTRPATAPTEADTAPGFLPIRASKVIHVIIATAAAVLVFKNAFTAIPFTAKDEPALNPNQPIHKRAVPSSTNGIFTGIFEDCFLLPRKIAPARAATPEEVCTTSPPAKSVTPHDLKRPSGCPACEQVESKLLKKIEQ